MTDLDKDALCIAKNVFLVRAASDPVADIIVPLRTAILAYLAALPRAAGVPEAEPADQALQQISLLLGGSDEWADQVSMIADVIDLVKNAVPSGEAVAQAYRAGFKAGKVWAEPALSGDQSVLADMIAYGTGFMRDGTHISATKVFAAPSAELNEAEQRDVLYNAARYSEDGHKFYPGATTKALHVMGYKIVPVAAPPVESQEMTEEAAQFLWALLDDIDTVSDAVKADDKAYRQMVERIQRRRFEVGDTDGYTVMFKVRGAPKSGEK